MIHGGFKIQKFSILKRSIGTFEARIGLAFPCDLAHATSVKYIIRVDAHHGNLFDCAVHSQYPVGSDTGWHSLEQELVTDQSLSLSLVDLFNTYVRRILNELEASGIARKGSDIPTGQRTRRR